MAAAGGAGLGAVRDPHPPPPRRDEPTSASRSPAWLGKPKLGGRPGFSAEAAGQGRVTAFSSPVLPVSLQKDARGAARRRRPTRVPAPAGSRTGARRSEVQRGGEGRSKERISLSGIWGDADRLTATPPPAAAPRLSPALNTNGGKRSDRGRESPAEPFPASCSPAGTSPTSITSGIGACHAWAAELRAAPAEAKPCPEGPWFYAAWLRYRWYGAEPSCPLPAARCPPPTAARTANSSAEELKIARSPAQGEHGAASSGPRQPQRWCPVFGAVSV